MNFRLIPSLHPKAENTFILRYFVEYAENYLFRLSWVIRGRSVRMVHFSCVVGPVDRAYAPEDTFNRVKERKRP